MTRARDISNLVFNNLGADRDTTTPLIINGDMQIAQRGDQTGITSSQYINIDRFFVNMENIGTWSFTQSTSTPDGLGFASSLKIDCTTADTSPAAGDNFYLSMQSEGQNLQVFEKGTSDAKTSTLAYWIKCNKTGNYVVELWDRTNDRHVAVLKTISSADTWQKVVCNFPADTSGALANTNARSIMISWAFATGTDDSSGTLPSAWQARVDANRFAGTTLALSDNTDNEVLITGVQWEVGTFDANSIADFQFEDRATSLARCQRYCYQEDNSDTFHHQANGFFSSSTLFIGLVALPVALRSTPTLVTSGSYQIAGTGGYDGSNFIIIDSTGTDLTKIQVRATVSGATAGQGAVLRNKDDVNAIFRLDSEL